MADPIVKALEVLNAEGLELEALICANVKKISQ